MMMVMVEVVDAMQRNICDEYAIFQLGADHMVGFL